MIGQNLVARGKTARGLRRRQYNRLASAIAGLSPADLADLRADRGEMLRQTLAEKGEPSV